MTDLLDRPTYDFIATDRLLGLPGGTAKRWIDGYVRSGHSYAPVVRESPTGSETVTWGEFVETRFLAMYRERSVPMIKMRPAVDRLRELLNVKYPLAHSQPYIGNGELVLSMQEEIHLESSLRLWVVRSGQLMLSDPAQKFHDTVEFERVEGIVQRIWPTADRLVEINPLKQFGSPVVRAVPTDVIAELVRAGDSLEMIGNSYELAPELVEAALRFELQLAVAA